MFLSLETNCYKEVEVVSLMIESHENISIAHPSLTNNIKQFSVSSSITRLYAIYEYFVETAISDYLDILSECVNFNSLSNEFKNEYRLGVSIILSKIDQERYDHLNVENIVKWYYEAISNIKPYKFITQALTRHEQNLRLNTVESLLSKIEIKNLKSWLNNHPSVKALYNESNAIYDQFESELRNFVQLRNDASHGTLNFLESKHNLFRFRDITKAAISAIGSYLRKYALEYLVVAERMIEIGYVSETFTNNGAFVAVLKSNTHLRIGKELYFVSTYNCTMQNIISIMINNVKVPGVKIKFNNLEIGIKCEKSVRKGTRIFYFK